MQEAGDCSRGSVRGSTCTPGPPGMNNLPGNRIQYCTVQYSTVPQYTNFIYLVCQQFGSAEVDFSLIYRPAILASLARMRGCVDAYLEVNFKYKYSLTDDRGPSRPAPAAATRGAWPVDTRRHRHAEHQSDLQ